MTGDRRSDTPPSKTTQEQVYGLKSRVEAQRAEFAAHRDRVINDMTLLDRSLDELNHTLVALKEAVNKLLGGLRVTTWMGATFGGFVLLALGYMITTTQGTERGVIRMQQVVENQAQTLSDHSERIKVLETVLLRRDR